MQRAAAPSGGSGDCACHEDSQRHQRRQRAPQSLLKALRTAPATRTVSGTSGDNARRSPSGGSGECEGSQRAASGASGDNALPQTLLEALETAPATRTASGTSGDNARRSPFWRLWRVLWVLRLAHTRQHTPKRRGVCEDAHSGDCACHEDSQRHQRRQRAPPSLLEALKNATRAAAPSGGSGDCACHEDSQWHQRRQRAPQSLLEALKNATRAAAPSGGSGDCACHEDSQWHQRRQRAPQSLLEALGTAPATRTVSGTTHRSPFWRLWRVRGQSAGSQRRQRAPQPLLEALESALGTAPCTYQTTHTEAQRSM